MQLGALLGVEMTLDAVIDKSHQACCNYNTTKQVSKQPDTAAWVLCTHSEMSDVALRMLSSVMRM